MASSLMTALNQQPVSVAVEADQSAFQRYSGGIVTSGCGTSLDHGVLAAGYDSAEGYFLVKNSWGASWGDAGYLKIGTSGNVCGITSQPSYPTVAGGAPTPPPAPTPPTPPPPTPTPSPSPGSCHAISPVATDSWCDATCAMGVCPSDLCECDGVIV